MQKLFNGLYNIYNSQQVQKYEYVKLNSSRQW